MTKPIIIDTREPFEYMDGHVDGAINIPPAEFMSGQVPSQLRGVPRDQEIIVYCRSGSRSNVVMQILQQQGLTDLKNGINKQQVEKYLG